MLLPSRVLILLFIEVLFLDAAVDLLIGPVCVLIKYGSSTSSYVSLISLGVAQWSLVPVV